jgi:putative glutathione S-transferase
LHGSSLPTPLGWRFPTADDTDAAGENVIPDPVPGHEGVTHLRDIYFRVNPQYEGRFTVPVLYDKKTDTIVNNESSEILRMFGTEVGIGLSLWFLALLTPACAVVLSVSESEC